VQIFPDRTIGDAGGRSLSGQEPLGNQGSSDGPVIPAWARATAVIKTSLSDYYRDYIACLNRRDWPKLSRFVHDEVIYNGRRIGLAGYRAMLERDVGEIPDLYFSIELMVSDPPYIASRLGFECTPKGNFLGLPVNGKRITFAENVFYEFRDDKIDQVWSVIDRAAIEAQL